jgi:hypothetical protein
MIIRFIGPLLCGGLLALVSTMSALAQSYSYPHNSGINPDRTTVKNSKSNTGDRMGGGRAATQKGAPFTIQIGSEQMKNKK